MLGYLSVESIVDVHASLPEEHIAHVEEAARCADVVRTKLLTCMVDLKC